MTITISFPADAELDVRVAKGAALFDVHHRGWEDVDLDALDMSDTQFCVAAQVVCNSRLGDDSYMTAMDKLGLDDPTAREAHGFDLNVRESHLRYREVGNDHTLIFAPLTDAWKRLILGRREGP